MATLTIRNLPDDVRDQLRKRAANRGVSMEAEARTIIAQAIGVRSGQEIQSAAAGIQEWVAARRKPVHGEISAVQALIRDRRREVILEVLREGGDPEKIFGENLDSILADAKWSRRHIRQLASKTR